MCQDQLVADGISRSSQTANDIVQGRYMCIKQGCNLTQMHTLCMLCECFPKPFLIRDLINTF